MIYNYCIEFIHLSSQTTLKLYGIKKCVNFYIRFYPAFGFWSILDSILSNSLRKAILVMHMEREGF